MHYCFIIWYLTAKPTSRPSQLVRSAIGPSKLWFDNFVFRSGYRILILTPITIDAQWCKCITELDWYWFKPLQWRHNRRESVSNYRLTIVYSTVYSSVDQRKHQSSASLAFVRWVYRWPLNSPHKWPVTWKMFPFDDVIMWCLFAWSALSHYLNQCGKMVTRFLELIFIETWINIQLFPTRKWIWKCFLYNVILSRPEYAAIY